MLNYRQLNLWLLILGVLFLQSCCLVETLSAIPTETEGLTLADERSLYLNLTQYPGEACNRICISGQRRACFFEFNLENYQAMGVACGDCDKGVVADCNHPQCVLGDGVEKGVMSINRQVPGPAIQVCKDDLVIVDVINQAGGTAAAIHWHGIHMRETPYMDGVPFVTQCPISFANTFRYEFTATESGTHFYHSHSGHHRVNGQYGALIVREPSENVTNLDAFDYDLPEHYILISDWMHAYGEQLFPGLPSSGISPDSVLINGRGSYFNPETKERISVPPTRYNVKPGKRYRFRVINSVSHACPFQLQVQGHRLTIVASDGHDVEPRTFDTLVSNSGERYDFVLTADQATGDFWIRVRGMEFCARNPIETVALLRYVDDDVTQVNDENQTALEPPLYNEEYAPGVILNHPRANCFTDNSTDHCVSELRAVDADEDLHKGPPAQQFFLGFKNVAVPKEEIFKPGLYKHFFNPFRKMTMVGTINNISLIFPSYPPLTQPRDIDEGKFCDESNRADHCRENVHLCACVHRLQIRLGAIVELIIVDESPEAGRLHHPFHFHGHRFLVTKLGQDPNGKPMTVNSAKRMERHHKLARANSNDRPPFKDTVSIPSRGYAIVRFRADNPGFWLMHCHYEWHLATGMGLIVQVGQPKQMVSAPRDFPKCGNYQPKVRRLRS